MKSFDRLKDTKLSLTVCDRCDAKAFVKVDTQSLCHAHAATTALHEVLNNPGGRRKLPDRRMSHTISVAWLAWQRAYDFQVTLGFALDGTVSEVFVKGSKIGSDMDAQLDDTCVLMSRLLQFGDSVQDLAKSLGREGADPHSKGENDEPPVASLVGKIANAAAAEEIIYKVQVARFYKT